MNTAGREGIGKVVSLSKAQTYSYEHSCCKIDAANESIIEI